MAIRLRNIGLLFLLATFVLASCGDNPASLSSEEPPQLPPIESMQVDFSTFEGTQTAKREVANTNFSQAALRALVMKTVVDLNLAIPRALLVAAEGSEAEFNDEGQWEWSYSHTAAENNYEVRLLASAEGSSGVHWEFFVTNSLLDIDNKLLFEGTSSNDGSQGTWTYFNVTGEGNEPVSEIEWSVNGEDEVSLRLEVVSDRYNNLGDFIEYSFDGTVKKAIYFNAGQEETTELQWNVETKAGYLIAPNYNNGERACWDENFEDVVCE